MSGAIVNGQVAVQDPQNPSVQEFYVHPDFRAIAAFFLGWVFLLSAYHVVCCSLLRDALRRLGLALRFKRLQRTTGDVESSASQEKANESDRAKKVPMSRRDVNDSAFVFILNLCFAFAALAEFSSLLDLGSPNGDTIACAFVVAWSSMAAQSARIAGLLLLGCRLKRLGAKSWEIYIFLVGLLGVLGLVFALNATGPGTTSIVGAFGTSICYKEIYLPLSLSLSSTLMALELYAAGRLASLGIDRSSSLRTILTSLLNVDFARPVSLLILDICTVIPGAMWVNTLAQNIPFSFGALLVIAVFNYVDRKHVILHARGDLNFEHKRNESSLNNVQRTSYNSLLTPSPFLLHFLDSPLEPRADNDVTSGRHSHQAQAMPDPDRDIVLHITSDSVEEVPMDSAVPPPPQSALPNLEGMAQKRESQTRKILPFQVEYIRRLEEEADALQTGPVVRQPRERPQVFVVIHDEETEAPAESHGSRTSVLGSDIIRMTPHTPRKNRKSSRLWSPDSTAHSCIPYSPSLNSAVTPGSAFHTSLSTSSAYTYRKHSQSVETPSDDCNRGMLSPGESSRGSWRFLSRQSYTSTRTQAREELPTVAELPSDADSGLSMGLFGHVRSKRQTFGQSWKNNKQDRHSVKSRKSPISIVVPPPTLARVTLTSREATSPMLIPPLPPVSPLPMASSYGAGRGGGLLGVLGGTGVVRGPRPPPTPQSPGVRGNLGVALVDESSFRTPKVARG